MENLTGEKFGTVIRVGKGSYGLRTIGGTDFGKATRSDITCKVTVSTIRKWKCLLAKDCEHYGPIVTAIAFL